MKIRNRLFILIMAAVIACAQWVPAFAVSQGSEEPEGTYTTKIRQEVKAEAAVVIDAETGDILYGKDAYSKREPASTTKIVTCLVALDHLELDQQIKVKTKAVEMGNIIGVKKGEKFTFLTELFFQCFSLKKQAKETDAQCAPLQKPSRGDHPTGRPPLRYPQGEGKPKKKGNSQNALC